MTTAEAAQHFNVSERTIRRWIQAGKLFAEWTNGQWSVRVTEWPDECLCDLQVVLSSDRMSDANDRTDILESEVDRLREELKKRDARLEQAEIEITSLSALVEEKTDEIKRLHALVDRRDETISELTCVLETAHQALDREQQLNAFAQKNIAAVASQLSQSQEMLADMRQKRSWWRRIFGR